MGEWIVFVIFAIAAVAGGLSMVTARNPVYSAMGLLLTMFSMAVFYVLNLAHFVAASLVRWPLLLRKCSSRRTWPRRPR